MSHELLNRHAKYLRYVTMETLAKKGFTVDLGETQQISEFWNLYLHSPDPASTEVWHATYACGAIVVFPSSVGAICELSLFATKPKLAQKTCAVVHADFDSQPSFFRRGLLEYFRQEKGDRTFVDYQNHDACVSAAVQFVEGEYTRALRTAYQIREANQAQAALEGTIFHVR